MVKRDFGRLSRTERLILLHVEELSCASIPRRFGYIEIKGTNETWTRGKVDDTGPAKAPS